jgi:hypothetical protein
MLKMDYFELGIIIALWIIGLEIAKKGIYHAST